MSVEKLSRVMHRIRRWNPNEDKVTYVHLRKAIMLECGTDPSTYTKNVKALKLLGWIKTWSKKKCLLTNDDLTEM